jgi:hypothetical protein
MFQKLTAFTTKVADLADKPTLSPTDLKAQFDAAPDEVREYLNLLIDDLNIEFPKYASKQQETWSDMPLFNSWIVNDGAYAKFRKDEFGVVHVRAYIKGGAITAFAIISNLPTGFRPLENRYFSALCWTGSGTTSSSFVTANLQVTTAGDIKILDNAGNGWMILDLSFETF